MSTTLSTSAPTFSPQYLPQRLIGTLVAPAPQPLRRLTDTEIAAIAEAGRRAYEDGLEDDAYQQLRDLGVLLHARKAQRERPLPKSPRPPRARMVLDPDYATYCDIATGQVRRQALPFVRGKTLVFHGVVAKTRLENVIASIKASIAAGARYVDATPNQGPRQARFTPRFERKAKLEYSPIQVTHLHGDLAVTEEHAELAPGQERLIEKQFGEDLSYQTTMALANVAQFTSRGNKAASVERLNTSGTMAGLMPADAILADGCQYCGLVPAKCVCVDPLIDAPRRRVDRDLNGKTYEYWVTPDEVGYAGFTDNDARIDELTLTLAYWRRKCALAVQEAHALGKPTVWRRRKFLQHRRANKRWGQLRLRWGTRPMMQFSKGLPVNELAFRALDEDERAMVEQLQKLDRQLYAIGMQLEGSFNENDSIAARCEATRAEERIEELLAELEVLRKGAA